MNHLFHISEDASIRRFEPRLPPSSDSGVEELVVWAVDKAHVPNYLLPRDCPRVTFYALPASNHEDVERLVGPSASSHIVAIEAAWFERASRNKICIYEFSPDTFSLVDSGAGYHISKVTVVPTAKRKVESPLNELVSLGVELRVVASLWPLHDAVIASSLQFSCIRMRNAQPRIKTVESL
jgi:hypothetical protein